MVPGMLTLKELEIQVEKGEIDTVIAAFSDMYGRLMGKRIAADYFLETTVRSGMHTSNYLMTTDVEMDLVPDYQFANWKLGYGDMVSIPDMKTLRRAAWLDRTALVLCDIHDEESGEPVDIAPRNILKRQLQASAELGYQAQGASELEYYLFDETYSSARAKHFHNLDTLAEYNEDYLLLPDTWSEPFHSAVRRHLRDSGVPVEYSKGEWAAGQRELNIRFAELLTMADRHQVYKQCLKETAHLQNLAVTFMAKYHEDLAGSSCHIHLSLWDETGETNQFDGNRKHGPVQSSDLFRWFLGGCIAHTTELMPFYAPTVNSYKRYQRGSWAPTGLAWSYDNRTAAYRVVGHGQSLRLEARMPGADVNPYLAFAALLASGLDGIQRQTDPPEMFVGDVYAAADLQQVPATLPDAIARLEGSQFARDTFGDSVIEHYLHFFKTEQAKFEYAVTDWERCRYFEQI